MHVKHILVAVAVFCAVAGIDSATAQEGSIAGNIFSGNGDPVSGASVRLDYLAPSQVYYETLTLSDGAFRFDRLPEGFCS
jgi:hypothetical protein